MSELITMFSYYFCYYEETKTVIFMLREFMFIEVCERLHSQN